MNMIDRVLKRATKKRASPAWLEGGVTYYEISARAANQIMREAYGEHRRGPRPGYVVDLPATTHHGRKGRWALSNHGGKYELMFHYEA